MSKSKQSTSPIVRGDTPFIELRRVGELGDNGKAVMSIGYSGKLTPHDAKYPFASLVIQVAEAIRPMIGHGSGEAAREDVMLLSDYVDRLLANTGVKKTRKPKARTA